MQERRPRSTGELLTDAMAVLRQQFKTLTPLALPFCALDLVLREGGQATLGTVRAAAAGSATSMNAGRLVELAAASAGSVGLFLGSVVVTQLLAVGVIGATGEAWHGRQPTVGHAVGSIMSRGASQVVTFVLFVAVLVVATILPMLAGVLLGVVSGDSGVVFGAAAGALVALLLAIVLGLRWGMFAQVTVLEGHVAMAAFARSADLMASRGVAFFEGAKFRLSLMFLVVFGLSGSLQALFAIPRFAAAAVLGLSTAEGFPPLLSMPLGFVIPFALLEVGLNSVIVPFTSVLATLFYFDLRVRAEALDLGGAP